MTGQVGDWLMDGERTFRVRQFPLAALGSWEVVTRTGEAQPRFLVNRTSCYRGYIASWKIIDGKLHLVRFDALGTTGLELTIADVFGTNRLFADWYTGELCASLDNRLIPLGKKPNRENVWEFAAGCLVREYVRTNSESG